MGIRGFSYTEEIMKKITAIILVLCMLFSMAACGSTNSGNEAVIVDPEPGKNSSNENSGFALASLTLPETAQYPNENDYYKNGSFDSEGYNKVWGEWMSMTEDKQKLADSYKGKLYKYLSLSKEYLKGKDGSNVVCSPINIYFALAMLAECSEGNTRAEILDVLGAQDLKELRSVAKALWEQTYYDSENYKTDLASSIWLNKQIGGTDLQFDMDTIAALAQYYYATAYSGDAEDKGFSRAFKDWLNEHTGGLLEEQVESLDDFTQDLVAAIATSVYFKASWMDEFDKSVTYEDVFRSPSGDVQKSYMRSLQSLRTCKGNGFTAVFIPFTAAGGMWIFLPDEGISPEKLNLNGSLINAVLSADVDTDTVDSNGDSIFKFDHVSVDLTLPKFDVDAELDLVGMLKNMGIRDVFDPQAADLSNLVKNVQAYVSSATHAARVKIDEEGCEAAAFTVIMVKATGFFQEEPMEFKVDRPFAFAITGSDGLPLFTGIVNEP